MTNFLYVAQLIYCTYVNMIEAENDFLNQVENDSMPTSLLNGLQFKYLILAAIYFIYFSAIIAKITYFLACYLLYVF